MLILTTTFLVMAALPALSSPELGPITMTGPDQDRRVVIGDMDIARKFAPIGGGSWLVLGHQIADAVDPSKLSGPYTVEFSAQESGPEAFSPFVYRFSYFRDEDTGFGYVLLSETAEGYFNVLGTWTPMGWYRASDAWDEVMAEYLPGRPGDLPLPGGTLLAIATGVVLIIASVYGVRSFRPPRGRATWHRRQMRSRS